MGEKQQQEMEREKQFAVRLEQIKKKAKAQGFFIEEDQIQETFADLMLSKEQLQLVMDYLKTHKIGIGAPVDTEEYLTKEEQDTLQEYSKTLPKFSSNQEKEALTLLAMNGQKEAQEKLVERYLVSVMEIAKLYSGQGVMIEDLIGEGNVAATVAITMLECVENPKEAEEMIVKLVMDAMEAFIEKSRVNDEEDDKAAEFVNRVADQAKELAEGFQRNVTMKELAAETDLTVEEILKAVRISGGNIQFLQMADED